jgi:hypothetical protein
MQAVGFLRILMKKWALIELLVCSSTYFAVWSATCYGLFISHHQELFLLLFI